MNVLLLDKNIYYCQTLMNAMTILNKEIRISYIATSLEELTHIYDVDVVLADYEFYGSGIEMIFDNCQFIYLSDAPDNKIAFPKDNIDLIIKHIERKSHTLSEEYIEKMLYSELVSLGYSISTLGSKCMLEALKVIYYSNKTLPDIKLVKDIYPVVAEKLGISPAVVKGNMYYATRMMLKKANKEYLMQYFNYNLKHKVGVKLVLHQIIKKVRSIN